MFHSFLSRSSTILFERFFFSLYHRPRRSFARSVAFATQKKALFTIYLHTCHTEYCFDMPYSYGIQLLHTRIYTFIIIIITIIISVWTRIRIYSIFSFYCLDFYVFCFWSPEGIEFLRKIEVSSAMNKKKWKKMVDLKCVYILLLVLLLLLLLLLLFAHSRSYRWCAYRTFGSTTWNAECRAVPCLAVCVFVLMHCAYAYIIFSNPVSCFKKHT